MTDTNARISDSARELLERLRAISGTRTMSGQHNYPNHGSLHSDAAARIGGAYPAVWGSDFGFAGGDDKDSVLARPQIVKEAIRQHQAGSVVTLMWHAVRPIEDEPVTFIDSIQGRVADGEWDDLLTPGTEIHARWIAQVDTVAGFLTQLRDAGVPVLWRPYHEMNGDWFWWCGRSGPRGYSALWRALHDRLVRHHALDNLLWVWNANAPSGEHAGPYGDFYPGHDVVDVLASDIYRGDFAMRYYDDLVALASGKPIAIGECGELPSAEILNDQPLWCWFMTWSGMIEHANTEETVRAVYASPRVLHRPAHLPG
jgi:mannan endo-1,4-beta-mannosidase